MQFLGASRNLEVLCQRKSSWSILDTLQQKNLAGLVNNPTDTKKLIKLGHAVTGGLCVLSHFCVLYIYIYIVGWGGILTSSRLRP